MLNPSRKLAELVRILEESDYIFAADPAEATRILQPVADGAESKLIRRAQIIDRDRRLTHTLERARAASFWLWIFAAMFLFSSGFSATYLLMDSQGLNFFLILASVLGMNTLMLAVWLVSVALRFKFGDWVSSPNTWLRGKDAVNQAVLRLYSEEWHKSGTRWLLGATSHSMWLATLSGMLVSVLLLLLVRQYTFNWESTLLTDAASVKAIEWLSWLPAKIGFPVPDAEAVLNGRLNSNITDARAWSGLLVGSILVYGIVPRLLAWLVCKILLRAAQTSLPLDKPYYRQIIQKWQTKIVDADTQSERIEAVSAPVVISADPKWAVMLETEWGDESWFAHTLGQEWLPLPAADSRERVAELVQQLQQQPVQLLIGVRAHTVPDRGVLRQLARLAQAAQGGALVQLLVEDRFSDGTDYLQQWQQALNELNIAWLNPPKISQQMRLAAREAV